MAEEIKGITWDLDGALLRPWNSVQRLYDAGFTDVELLATFWAVIMAESGGYLEAWHHNVVRNDDGTIAVSSDGLFEVKSTDLGFIQRNVPHDPHVFLPITGDQSQLFVNDLFAAYPELARADSSAKIAKQLYDARGFQPWFAYSNGSYKKNLGAAAVEVGNYIALKNGLRPLPFVKKTV